MLNNQEWCRIDPKGNLAFINWDVAEQLAEDNRTGKRRDEATAVASLAVAVRDYVLSVPAPKITNK